jgi:Tol biopolymer transport system component
MPAKRRSLLFLLLLLGLLVLPDTAIAAWPGNNGRIVYRALVPGFEAEGQEPVGLAWTTGRPGDAPHQLTADPSDTDPQVSPNGRLIVFSREVEPEQQWGAVHLAVFVIHFDQSGLRQLTDPPEECADRKATFDPRGERLFFVRHCHGANKGTDTWSIDVDGTDLTKLEGDRARSAASVLSPTGRQVVFLRRTETGPHLISMRPDGSHHRDLTPRPNPQQQIEDPDFSPNGRVIVFSTSATDLWTIRANGRNLKPLSNRPPGYGEPAFSPDGREVVAVAHTRSGPASLVRFEVGGDGRAREVPQVRYGDMPIWAPRVR